MSDETQPINRDIAVTPIGRPLTGASIPGRFDLREPVTPAFREKESKNMFQNFHELNELEEYLRLLRGLFSVEYSGVPSARRLPRQLTELYRTSVLALRGVPAIDELQTWASEHVSPAVPTEHFAPNLDSARKALRAHDPEVAQGKLYLQSYRLLDLAREKLSDLPLEAIAPIAAFSSLLVTLGNFFTVGLPHEAGFQPAPTYYTKYWPVDENAGRREEQLIYGLVETIGYTPLFEPVTKLTHAIVRSASYECLPAAHAGLILLLWATGNGEFDRLRRTIAGIRDQEIAELVG